MAQRGALRPLTRAQLEGQERRTLAPYAILSSGSRGRAYREPEHPYRTCFQRDRDRIIHSNAFRRLMYKTQVFVIHEGDYYRTRLTHTLEVSQIARTAARALRLNEDLVEALALAHDLGHGPFGHSGEDALRELMREHGGFDHNLQTLRIVETLEQRYPTFPGLNLTWEVRQGLNKHKGDLSLEAQLVDMADEIAYDHHDLDDGLTSGLLEEEGLNGIPLWQKAKREVLRVSPGLRAEMRKYQIVRRLIDMDVTDLLRESARRLRERRIRRPEDALRSAGRIIAFSPALERLRAPLKALLWKELYHHPRVVRMADKAQRFLKALFDVYLRNPQQLPRSTRTRLKTEETHRVVCDYIAGMTDRYALEEYKKMFHPFEPT